MQGLFNFLIFIRPRASKIRKENPQIWYVCALVKAIFNKKKCVQQNQANNLSREEFAKISQGTTRRKTRRDSLNIIDLECIGSVLEKIAISDDDDSTYNEHNLKR
uniref:Uncharacterized protein n=1 Tax=Eucampia antarctica TaxID=49252 RepID=A0A7S2VZN9_9STRA|mmetsp:Transcript_12809/g.12425  ORF Transcript_12809/g.12425 Transcript_12809/m.12425 type:complete len:105 (+) Transcript_12809:2-316(+)